MRKYVLVGVQVWSLDCCGGVIRMDPANASAQEDVLSLPAHRDEEVVNTSFTKQTLFSQVPQCLCLHLLRLLGSKKMGVLPSCA